jgi:hypothetical protein
MFHATIVSHWSRRPYRTNTEAGRDNSYSQLDKGVNQFAACAVGA